MKVEYIEELTYSFAGGPMLYVPGTHIGHQADPFPCYPHSKESVELWSEKVDQVFPIDPNFAPDWYLPKFETLERVNGWTNRKFDYKSDTEDGTQQEWKAHIILLGKRTPIHPAITRYLVAHEYGHVVQYWIGRGLHINTNLGDGDNPLYTEYAELRGLDIEKYHNYGAKKWSDNIGEIFANDFRILLCRTEFEFWPHDVAYPTDVKGLKEWWLEKREKYAYRVPEQSDRQSGDGEQSV